MENTVVIGAQWGDEGKAKITDLLAEKADLIIRYQGGCNAGHTVNRSVPPGHGERDRRERPSDRRRGHAGI